MKTIFTYLIMTFLFTTIIFSQSNTYYVSPSGSNDTGDGSVGTPWQTIGKAIWEASDGDIIIAKDGTYSERIDVNKKITIQSENGYSNTTITSGYAHASVVNVSSDDVTINGFTVYHSSIDPSSFETASIYLSNAFGCTISNNRCGISISNRSMQGITLSSSGNNTIENNICSYNYYYGFRLRDKSDNNLVKNNTFSNNRHGIWSDAAGTAGAFNTFRSNNIEDNTQYGVYIMQGAELDFGLDDGSEVNKGNNTILNNNNGNIQFSNQTANSISCYNNYWGFTTEAEIETHIYDDTDNASYGPINFNPWLDDPLPVELTTFTASVVENNVKLDWQTATEVNNYGFYVERLAKSFLTKATTPDFFSKQKEIIPSLAKEGSTLVGGGWIALDFIEGHGNSNSTKHYSHIDKPTNSGKYLYRLKQIDIDGSFEYSDAIEVDVNINLPTDYSLSQNYPNPFNPTTTIQYTIPNLTHPLIPSREGKERSDRGVLQNITLKVYDVLGNEIATLVNEEKQSGVYEVQFDAGKLTSGVYYYQLITDNYFAVKRMVLIK